MSEAFQAGQVVEEEFDGGRSAFAKASADTQADGSRVLEAEDGGESGAGPVCESRTAAAGMEGRADLGT